MRRTPGRHTPSEGPGRHTPSEGPGRHTPSEGSGRHIVLVGMMGSGKTTVGAMLAERLDLDLLDSDVVVEERTGRTVAEIFATDGEATFRSEEREALAGMLARPVGAVVAAAGGSVLDPASRALMARAGIVVWLRADPSVLAERTRSGAHRPLLADDAEETLTRLAGEREETYQQVADVVVDVDDLRPGEVVDQVLSALAAHEEALR